MGQEPTPATLRLLWWNLNAPGETRADGQIRRVLALRPRPDVIAFCELKEHAAEFVRERLEPEYQVAQPPSGLAPDQKRVLLASRLDMRQLPIDRFRIPARHPVAHGRGFQVRPQAVRSMELTLGRQQVEVHAVHIPNGSSYGWQKIDHMWAVRYGLEGGQLPQILCGDFNAPEWESGTHIITTAQNRDGSFSTWTKSRPPYSEERPWEAEAWNEGERAVLEGLPDMLGMPDAFRERHPRARGVTWVPRGRDDLGRRFDHVFASRELVPVRCRHITSWRRPKVSDHSPVDVTFALRESGLG